VGPELGGSVSGSPPSSNEHPDTASSSDAAAPQATAPLTRTDPPLDCPTRLPDLCGNLSRNDPVSESATRGELPEPGERPLAPGPLQATQSSAATTAAVLRLVTSAVGRRQRRLTDRGRPASPRRCAPGWSW